jgi:hypothetical protein
MHESGGIIFLQWRMYIDFLSYWFLPKHFLSARANNAQPITLCCNSDLSFSGIIVDWKNYFTVS